jgi:flagellar assembly protein FliH
MAGPVDEGKLSAWERWELARFDAPPEETAAKPGEDAEVIAAPTAEEIERIHQEAHSQGHAAGLEEGRAAGRTEGYKAGYEEGRAKALAEAKRLATVADRLETALSGFDAEVADELLSLAIELARETVRSEISARPDTLLNVVREALAQLPHQHASIFLNPEDASLLRSYMGDQLAHAGHRIHEDVKLAPGDCMIEAGGSHIDATVATRWRRVLGGLGIENAWQGETGEKAP